MSARMKQRYAGRECVEDDGLLIGRRSAPPLLRTPQEYERPSWSVTRSISAPVNSSSRRSASPQHLDEHR
jgi:hypothetical protein